MKRPIENSYWVEEGVLLAGEYPRNKDEQSSRDKVNALLSAGVRVFIDLTEADEGLLPYSHLIGDAEHCRFPIQDVSAPKSIAAMKETLDTIDLFVRKGSLVYVHCWGGVGRTGLVAGCWLARRLGGPQAYLKLQELWKQCPKSAYRDSPETEAQRLYIKNWRAGQ
ncbi:MAG: dual specificity protein phosphatase family protein [Verrucomicrobia bacterium]|nr:dual specificity protein phosphatase family protein [Verrucomicrobiota bacterium]